MDFHYSDIVRADTYNTDGLCAGIALRRHKDPIGEVAGALRCQSRWRVLVGPLTNYHGTLGHRFSFIRVTIPECLPERLEIVSFANEFAFLYDGETPQTSVRAVTARGSQEIDTFVEDIDQALQDESRRQILHEFGSDSLPHATHDRFIDGTDLKGNAAKQVQSLIVKEMMAIDKERGLTTMKAWQKFVQVVSSRQRSEPFRSLEEYLPYRISDAGELFWFGLVTFAMALTIPNDEMELCKRLGQPAWKALALTNDLYSWNKERDAAAKLGAPYVINAIWVLMREHSISESRAQEVCRQKIQKYVEEAVRTADETKKRKELSLDVRKYTEAILYSISGNLVWSIYCPRYHPEETSSKTKRRGST